MTGNVGRALLQHAAELAPIVLPSLSQENGQAVIQGLANFWLALACSWVLNPKKFGEYCLHVDNMLRTHIPWHPCVPAIHLDLVHGEALAEYFYPIPLGWLSEEPLEVKLVNYF